MRLVEHELEDHKLWLVAGLLEYAYEELGCSAEEYLSKDWTEHVESFKNDSLYKDGKHLANCSSVYVYCKRCTMERLADQAKQLIEKYANQSTEQRC